MEIDTNIGVTALNRSAAASRPTPSRRVLDEASFESSASLENALRKLPESRADAVERARNLIGDVQYPPEETIRKISQLLAIHLDSR